MASVVRISGRPSITTILVVRSSSTIEGTAVRVGVVSTAIVRWLLLRFPLAKLTFTENKSIRIAEKIVRSVRVDIESTISRLHLVISGAKVVENFPPTI
jgi:hypothetical protein